MPINIAELAKQCAAESPKEGGEMIDSAADIMTAGKGQVTVLSSPKYAHYLQDTAATACFVGTDSDLANAPKGLILLSCPDPEISFLNAVKILHPASKYHPQISQQAIIAEGVTLGKNIHLAPFATVASGASIGNDSQILANVHIGQNVRIGNNCICYPNVVIYDNAEIGNGVIIHSGAIIGSDGFGYKYRDNTHIKVPHVGKVVIGNNVEIGANACIDRAMLGTTTVGAGSKIDNLVQLGHNNQIGKNVIICGQSGISGSCEIGDGAVLAGSVGIADHVKIGAQAVVMARSGVSSDIPAKSQVFGFPAKDRKLAWQELAALRHLPQLLKKVKMLEKLLPPAK